MSGYASPDRPDQRLSDAERDEAVGRLAQANVEGRITTEEYGERSAAARRAVTRADLVPLFADLPESTAPEQEVPLVTGPGVPLPPPPPPAPGYGAAYANPEPVDRGSGSRALGGRVGATIMALTPFIAVALFFITGFNGSFAWSWLWFLLVPIAGIVIYGPGSEGRRSRR
jgi:uncharacterized protein DUF1707